MNCQEFSDLTPLHLSRELPAAQEVDFHAHAASCPHCAAGLARQFELDELLRETVLAGSLNADRVNLAVRQRINADVRSRRLRALYAVAATLILAVAGYLVYANTRLPAVYAHAALDHQREVIEQQRRNWSTDPSAIQALGARLGLSSVPLDELTPDGYQFHHGKLCRLDGRLFLHLTYTSANSEVSVFMQQPGVAQRQGGEVVNGHPCWRAGKVAVVEAGEMQALITGTPDPMVIARSAAGRL